MLLGQPSLHLQDKSQPARSSGSRILFSLLLSYSLPRDLSEDSWSRFRSVGWAVGLVPECREAWGGAGAWTRQLQAQGTGGATHPAEVGAPPPNLGG